jgi:putative ATPase
MRGGDPVAKDVLASTELRGDLTLKVVRGDLTQVRSDAIVNAANQWLAHGGGLAGAIVRRGGEEIQRQSDRWVKEHGPVSHDHPAITEAGDLPCKYVIHAVGPRWGEGEEDDKLRRAVMGALSLAQDRGLKSLALPAISSGIFGFPMGRAAGVIVDAIREFARSEITASLREIQIVLLEEDSAQIFAGTVARAPQGPKADT